MGRTLHLVDIENLGHDAFDRYGLALASLDAAMSMSWKPGDQVVIASNARLCRKVAWDIQIPHRYIVSPSGRDAADLALLDAAARANLNSIGRVNICSGDGGFSAIVDIARQAMVPVVVTAHRRGLSWRLSRVVDEIHLIRGGFSEQLRSMAPVLAA